MSDQTPPPGPEVFTSPDGKITINIYASDAGGEERRKGREDAPAAPEWPAESIVDQVERGIAQARQARKLLGFLPGWIRIPLLWIGIPVLAWFLAHTFLHDGDGVIHKPVEAIQGILDRVENSPVIENSPGEPPATPPKPVTDPTPTPSPPKVEATPVIEISTPADPADTRQEAPVDTVSAPVPLEAPPATNGPTLSEMGAEGASMVSTGLDTVDASEPRERKISVLGITLWKWDPGPETIIDSTRTGWVTHFGHRVRAEKAGSYFEPPLPSADTVQTPGNLSDKPDNRQGDSTGTAGPN